MAMSRSARIILLLVIDTIFFFVELIVGYSVGSLALVADSFHMLNDILGLVVALYAIKLAARSSTDARYSYGWNRAEILAALINSVFLLAICFSISLETVERFIHITEVTNPRLVVIVGSIGLAFNIIGLFLFHEHGHSHGHSHGASSIPPNISGDAIPLEKIRTSTYDPSGDSTVETIPIRTQRLSRSDSYSSYDHPTAIRLSLIKTRNEIALAQPPSPRSERNSRRISIGTDDINHGGHQVDATETPEQDKATMTLPTAASAEGSASSSGHPHSQDRSANHNHSHGHSHAGSMNMRGVLLHVFGDALGNVGVIMAGLIIWLTSWKFKFYFDPIISLVITIIIFSSAFPLVRSASFVLLHRIPATISLERVKSSILDVEGVLSLHELHIWQLSETKTVASVHVMASRNNDFMRIATNIRQALHHHGVHSCTIQPEYYNPRNSLPEGLPIPETSCLILCPPDQKCNPLQNACCPPPLIDV